MRDYDEYLSEQEPLDSRELEESAVDVMAVIAGSLGGFERQLRVFQHHHRDAASLKLARKCADDVHADICMQLRAFARCRS